jgi:hypothetical protein
MDEWEAGSDGSAMSFGKFPGKRADFNGEIGTGILPTVLVLYLFPGKTNKKSVSH